MQAVGVQGGNVGVQFGLLQHTASDPLPTSQKVSNSDTDTGNVLMF
jgi:hypothetical protein